MTNADFQNAPYGLSSTGLASKFGHLAPTGCNPSLPPLDCINAKKYLEDIAPSKHPFHTDTVPAIHYNQSGTFAVEFHVKNAGKAWCLRRIYNLVLGMWQSGKCQMEELRHGFFYLQIRESGVRGGGKYAPPVDTPPLEMLRVPLGNLVDDPWEYDPNDYGNLLEKAPPEYCLTGLVCEKAYVLFGDEVERFVDAKEWR